MLQIFQIDSYKMALGFCRAVKFMVLLLALVMGLFGLGALVAAPQAQETPKSSFCLLQGSRPDCSKSFIGPKLSLELHMPTAIASLDPFAAKMKGAKRILTTTSPEIATNSVAERGSASVSARRIDTKESHWGALLLGAFGLIMLLLTGLFLLFIYMYRSGSVFILGAKHSLVTGVPGKSRRRAPIDRLSAAKLERSDSEANRSFQKSDHLMADSSFTGPSFDPDTFESEVDDDKKPCFPEFVLNELEVMAAKQAVAVNPSFSRDPWAMGLASVRGHVRSENQDDGAVFALKGYQVVIVADGLGGLPLGRLASYQAVRAAALQVFRLFSYCDIGEEDLESVCMMVLRHAERRLRKLGQPLGLQDQALRTTLIVVIGGKQTISYAYIGDGGIAVYRNASEIVHLLRPQKADAHRPNLLTASLGPTPHGEPVSGKAERHQGDLIFVGTDGFFDRLEDSPEAFPVGTNEYITRIVQGALARDGNLQIVTEQVLDELSNWADESGFVFDDNSTLSLFGDGSRPHSPTDEESSAPDPAVDPPALEDESGSEEEQEI